MLEQLLTIARNTFTESIRQPIFTVLVLLGALGLLLSPALAGYTMSDDNKLMVDMSLSTILFACLLLAAFTATGILAREVENRTVLTVVSKPVSRPVFVLGKYLGTAAAIALAFFVLSLIFLFTRRNGVMSTASDQFDVPVILLATVASLVALGVSTLGNYLYRWVFCSTFMVSLTIAEAIAALLLLVVSKSWALQSPLTAFSADGGSLIQVLLALVLIFEAVLLLTAVAIAASTRLGQIMTLVICAAVFLIGLGTNSLSQLVNSRLHVPTALGLGDSFHAIISANVSFAAKIGYMLAKLLYLLFPNLQFLWPADALTQGNPFSGGYIATITLYSAFYAAVILCLAVALFQTREVG